MSLRWVEKITAKMIDTTLPKDSYGFPFHINTPGRLYELCAGTMEEYQLWVEGLQDFKIRQAKAKVIVFYFYFESNFPKNLFQLQFLPYNLI